MKSLVSEKVEEHSILFNLIPVKIVGETALLKRQSLMYFLPLAISKGVAIGYKTLFSVNNFVHRMVKIRMVNLGSVHNKLKFLFFLSAVQLIWK